MAASDSPFTIRELTGDKRTFRFTGRALPYRPFTLEGSQRHDLSWYAGSPEGTIQMLGAQENETTVNGWWKDRFIRQPINMSQAEQAAAGFTSGLQSAAGQLGNPPALIDGQSVNDVRELAEAMDDARRKGQLVEVSWLHTVRQGIISNFRQSWHTTQDLEWELRFVWINQGVQLADIPIQERNLDLSDSIVEIGNQLDTLEGVTDGALSVGTSNAAVDALRTIDDGITKLQQGAESLQDAVVTGFGTITSPISTAQRAAGIFNFMKITAIETMDAISRRLDAITLNEEENYGSRIDQRRSLWDSRKAAKRIAGIAAIREDQMLGQLNPELIKSFKARDNQDLRDVALEFYGRADDWRALMRFNNLSTSRLSRGQLIFVPRNPPQADQC